jgi:5-methylcytosine-specific restriction endonuclease McrA
VSGNLKRATIKKIMATDSTFEPVEPGPRAEWAGKCLHCRSWLRVAADGEPISEATIEHIQPQSHGGTDDIENLALACARCNRGKGVRHDTRRKGDPVLAALVEKLRAERMKRWRDPDPRLR